MEHLSRKRGRKPNCRGKKGRRTKGTKKKMCNHDLKVTEDKRLVGNLNYHKFRYS